MKLKILLIATLVMMIPLPNEARVKVPKVKVPKVKVPKVKVPKVKVPKVVTPFPVTGVINQGKDKRPHGSIKTPHVRKNKMVGNQTIGKVLPLGVAQTYGTLNMERRFLLPGSALEHCKFASDSSVVAKTLEAAKAGNPDAQHAMASFCMIKEEYVEAFRWYEKAALQGHAKAQYDLINCYRRGIGVEPDEAKAEDLRKKWHDNIKQFDK